VRRRGGNAVVVLLNDVLLAVSHAPAEIELALKPDVRVFAFTIAIAAATGVLFGLAPALGATGPTWFRLLKKKESALGRRVRRSRLTGAFVVAQVALSLILLVTRDCSPQPRQSVGRESGFDPVNRISLSVDLDSGIQRPSARHLLREVCSSGYCALPGVEATSLASRSRSPEGWSLPPSHSRAWIPTPAACP